MTVYFVKYRTVETHDILVDREKEADVQVYLERRHQNVEVVIDEIGVSPPHKDSYYAVQFYSTKQNRWVDEAQFDDTPDDYALAQKVLSRQKAQFGYRDRGNNIWRIVKIHSEEVQNE